MKIIPLKEGNFSTNKTKDFTLLTDENFDEIKGIKMSVQPFLVITKNDYILLDAGIGWKNNAGELIILEKLKENNINPEQITKVLLSHLHKDHVEGILKFTNNGFESNFPNAEIYIQKRELDFALQNTGNYSFDFDTLEKIIQLPHIIWMYDNIGKINNEISFEVTGGHTPFTQVFWIDEAGETAFYGADNLPQESYLKYHLAYKSDYDGRKAMELRQLWQQQAEEYHWKVLLYHDLEKAILEF